MARTGTALWSPLTYLPIPNTRKPANLEMPSPGMVEKAQIFGTRKIQPLSLGFVTYQLYGLGKFLKFLEPQLPRCKRTSRIPTLQLYLKSKGHMSEACSTVLAPCARRSSLPFLPLILVLCSLWSAQAPPFPLVLQGF